MERKNLRIFVCLVLLTLVQCSCGLAVKDPEPEIVPFESTADTAIAVKLKDGIVDVEVQMPKAVEGVIIHKTEHVRIKKAALDEHDRGMFVSALVGVFSFVRFVGEVLFGV